MAPDTGAFGLQGKHFTVPARVADVNHHISLPGVDGLFAVHHQIPVHIVPVKPLGQADIKLGGHSHSVREQPLKALAIECQPQLIIPGATGCRQHQLITPVFGRRPLPGFQGQLTFDRTAELQRQGQKIQQCGVTDNAPLVLQIKIDRNRLANIDVVDQGLYHQLQVTDDGQPAVRLQLRVDLPATGGWIGHRDQIVVRGAVPVQIGALGGGMIAKAIG